MNCVVSKWFYVFNNNCFFWWEECICECYCCLIFDYNIVNFNFIFNFVEEFKFKSFFYVVERLFFCCWIFIFCGNKYFVEFFKFDWFVRFECFIWVIIYNVKVFICFNICKCLVILWNIVEGLFCIDIVIYNIFLICCFDNYC